MSHQNPLLERLSWIASVLSFILSILVWLLPSPINFVSTSSSSSTTIITIFRLLIFSILLFLGIALIIFSVIKPKGQISFKFRLFGDWGAHTSMISGFMYMFLSLCIVLWWMYRREIFTIIAGILMFSLGVFMTVWGMKRSIGLIQGESEAQVKTGIEWFLIISVISLLITGIIVILLIRLTALP